MAPKRKLSYEEESAQLARRSLSLQNQGKRKWIEYVMSQRLDLVPALVQCLSQHGVTEGTLPRSVGARGSEAGTPASSEGGASSAATPPVVVPSGLHAAVAQPVPQAAAAPAAAATSNENARSLEYIPRQYQTYGALTIPYLVPMLNAISPTTLSPSALKALIPRGKKQLKKPDLLRLLEFTVDIRPCEDVPLELRSMARMLEHLSQRSMQAGRRARDLVLPPQWPLCGHFTLQRSGRGLSVTWQTTTPAVSKQVSLTWLGEHVNIATVSVDMNWSMREAALKAEGSGPIPLMVFFSTELHEKHFGTPPRVERPSHEQAVGGLARLLAPAMPTFAPLQPQAAAAADAAILNEADAALVDAAQAQPAHNASNDGNDIDEPDLYEGDLGYQREAAAAEAVVAIPEPADE